VDVQVDALERLEAGGVGLGKVGYGDNGLQDQTTSPAAIRAVSESARNSRSNTVEPGGGDATCRPMLPFALLTRITLFVSSFSFRVAFPPRRPSLF
jgi:hypothetical protein